ncbi:MAG: PorV/PorQ family protein [Elusimicrobiales bacterium]
MNTLKSSRDRAFVTAFLSAFVLSTATWILQPAFAGGPGSASVQILKTDMSPRALGMGGSFVAVADDIYAVNYNPAGIGLLYFPEASAMSLSGFEDSKLQSLAFGMPLPVTGLAGVNKPGLAVSSVFSQSGRFTSRFINSDGTVETAGMDAETNKVFALTYGEKVYSGEAKLDGYNAKLEQYLGLSAKYVGSELLGKYSASAFVFDAGWLMREPGLGLTFGAALSNYGTGIKYLKETEPLPSILRLGFSYQRPTVMDQSVLLALESDIYMNESLKSLRGGLEYHFEKLFDLRLGYKALEENSGPAIGFGVHYEGLSLDFAMSMASEIFNTSQISLTYKFANWRVGEYKKKVQYRDQEEDRPRSKKTARPAGKEPVKPRKPGTTPGKKDSDFFMIY